MTDSFGARLRRQRERQHITLAHIAASTKIKASLFEGLERDDVSKWPGGIFRRSFVRSYATAIGLDPDQVCQEFLERFPDGEAAPARRDDTRVNGSAASVRATAPVAVPSPPASHSSQLAASSAWGPWVNEPIRRTETAPPDAPANPVEPGLLQNSGIPAIEDDGDSLGESTPRLALADQGLALLRTPLPTSTVMRWRTVGLDLGLILVVAISAFIVIDHFWASLAVTSVAYYLLSTLLLGYTPGMLLFGVPAPVATDVPNSMERALEMRAELTSEPFTPASARPPRHPARSAAPLADEDAGMADDDALPYSALPQPVDISTRRARA